MKEVANNVNVFAREKWVVNKQNAAESLDERRRKKEQ
jgi:hypothetical protein